MLHESSNGPAQNVQTRMPFWLRRLKFSSRKLVVRLERIKLRGSRKFREINLNFPVEQEVWKALKRRFKAPKSSKRLAKTAGKDADNKSRNYISDDEFRDQIADKKDLMRTEKLKRRINLEPFGRGRKMKKMKPNGEDLLGLPGRLSNSPSLCLLHLSSLEEMRGSCWQARSQELLQLEPVGQEPGG